MRPLRLLLVLALAAPTAAAQSSAPLVVVAPDGREVTLSAATLAALPRTQGTATAHGHAFRYEGTELRSVLQAAGIATDSLRGAALSRVVRFVAADGYTAVLALTDLDPSIGARRVTLVDREDGKPLPADLAPRRVVIDGDGRPTRWVRQVTRIAIVDVR